MKSEQDPDKLTTSCCQWMAWTSSELLWGMFNTSVGSEISDLSLNPEWGCLPFISC